MALPPKPPTGTPSWAFYHALDKFENYGTSWIRQRRRSNSSTPTSSTCPWAAGRNSSAPPIALSTRSLAATRLPATPISTPATSPSPQPTGDRPARCRSTSTSIRSPIAVPASATPTTSGGTDTSRLRTISSNTCGAGHYGSYHRAIELHTLPDAHGHSLRRARRRQSGDRPVLWQQRSGHHRSRRSRRRQQRRSVTRPAPVRRAAAVGRVPTRSRKLSSMDRSTSSTTLRCSRSFPVTERVNLRFNMDIFNLFNNQGSVGPERKRRHAESDNHFEQLRSPGSILAAARTSSGSWRAIAEGSVRRFMTNSDAMPPRIGETGERSPARDRTYSPGGRGVGLDRCNSRCAHQR